MKGRRTASATLAIDQRAKSVAQPSKVIEKRRVSRPQSKVSAVPLAPKPRSAIEIIM